MSTALEEGWYAFDYVEESTEAGRRIDMEGLMGPYGRRSLAQYEADDWHRSYIAHWTGTEWSEIIPTEDGAAPASSPRIHTQSRIDSFAEAVTNTAIGFLVSLVTWIVVARMYGIPMSASTSLSITAIFTVVSVARQYVLRRLFDGRSPWQAIKACMSRVSRYG